MQTNPARLSVPHAPLPPRDAVVGMRRSCLPKARVGCVEQTCPELLLLPPPRLGASWCCCTAAMLHMTWSSASPPLQRASVADGHIGVTSHLPPLTAWHQAPTASAVSQRPRRPSPRPRGRLSGRLHTPPERSRLACHACPRPGAREAECGCAGARALQSTGGGAFAVVQAASCAPDSATLSDGRGRVLRWQR
jgi:hypothetical protein